MIFGLAGGASHPIQTLSDLDRYLGAIADAGFTMVTLSESHLCGDPSAAAALLRTHGLRCSDLGAGTITRDDEAAMATADALRPVVDVIEPVGVLAMVRTRINDESIDRIGRIAERIGAPVLLEFGTAPLPSLSAASEVVGVLGTDVAGIIADTYHFFRAGSTIDMLDTVPIEHVTIVQFDDALPALSDDYMEETLHRRAWPGEGELDLSDFAGRLRRRGWDGIVSIEVFSDTARELPIEQFAECAFATTLPYWT
ncbi:MAG: sugar phosphate isomerase/epimerase family protein [Acidimicrobiia bacterium]